MHIKSAKLVFITVNYNGLADTKALLHSILDAQLSMDYAVMVVDNGSTNDEWAPLQAEFGAHPEIIGIRSNINLGFAGGNNLGIGRVEAAYYYFINNDTLLPADADLQIRGMVDFLEMSPAVAGLSPKIMYVDVPNMIQFAGCTALTNITLRNRQIGYQELDRGQYSERIEIPYLHGAAMLVSGRVVREIGPMPTLYFLYYEEVDWCHTMRHKYVLYYYPDAYILHKESASTGMDSPFKTYYLSRNRLVFAFRHRKGITRFLAISYLIVVLVIRAFTQMIKGHWPRSKATMKGLKDGLKWIIARKKD